jgi:hypothetical protein
MRRIVVFAFDRAGPTTRRRPPTRFCLVWFRFAALALALGLFTAGVSRLYQARLNKAREHEWLAAALQGKVQRLRDLADAGLDINAARPDGYHVLQWAVDLYASRARKRSRQLTPPKVTRGAGANEPRGCRGSLR